MTMVERLTRCIVGWGVVWERTEEIAQALVDAAPQAVLYFSDDFPTYSALIYKPGIHLALTNKSQTYSVEGDNADLRPYLARLARRSRCFSRSIQALMTGGETVRFCLEPASVVQTALPCLSCSCHGIRIPLILDTPAKFVGIAVEGGQQLYHREISRLSQQLRLKKRSTIDIQQKAAIRQRANAALTFVPKDLLTGYRRLCGLIGNCVR